MLVLKVFFFFFLEEISDYGYEERRGMFWMKRKKLDVRIILFDKIM